MMKCRTDRPNKFVSLVMTVYNREQFLGAAIESALAQTYPQFELLVWDDGSTDRTLAIARDYANRDQRVRVVAASHQGRVKALQAAIAQTEGTYLGWLDSDDRLAPTALEATVAALGDHPTVGMVYTDYLEIDAADRVLRYGQRCRIPYSKERLLLDFITFHFRLIRRSVFDQVNGLAGALDYVEDYDLCLRLSEVTSVCRVPQPLYYYRQHGGNASRQWRLEQILRSRTVIQRALQRRGLDRQYDLFVDMPAGRFQLRRKASPFVPLLPRMAIAGTLLVLPLGSSLPAGYAQAQSITPAADGTNTIVTPNGNRFDISGGTRSQDGANLFQSFQQFGLTTNQVANFLATPQVRNILGRVVGGNASVIDGLIQVTGGSANLYLMNPAGVVFGANASLNVPGAFTATTATGIGFNNRWFSAAGANDYAALVGDPDAFGFAVPQPGSIVNAGTLAVTSGQLLSLLGGTVVNTGTLTAPAGNITIAAVPGQSLVRLQQPGSLLSFEITPVGAPIAGTGLIAVTPQPSLPNRWTLPIATLPELLTGGNLQSATGIAVNPDGTIRLLTVPQQSIAVMPGTAIAGGTLTASAPTTGNNQTGGTVQVLGNQVAAIGATINASGNTGGGKVLLGGDAHGQGTVPNATNTTVDFGSTITANSLLNGSGGQVIVWSNNVTQFFGTISAQGGPTAGNGGFVEVSGKGNLAYRGFVDTSAPAGTVGTLLLDPENITIVSGNGYGSADGLLPTIFSGDFPGATLTVSQNALQNTRGDVLLEATNDITIQPLENGALSFSPGIPSVTFRADADGNGVGNFSMAPGDALVTSPGAGTGSILISGANLSLGTLQTSATFADGGSVTLAASGNITATAIDTSIVDSIMGFGYNGGSVNITAGGAVVINNAVNTAGTQNGGAITLSATGNIAVRDLLTSGGILGGSGNGGSISIASNLGAIATGNLLTTGSNKSGNVTLQAANVGADVAFASIDTSAPTAGGVGGLVNVTAGRFVRGTSFTSSNPTATITAAADSSGAITIRHGGGAVNQPFTVGDATTNGTAGAIVSGTLTTPNAIDPPRSFTQSFAQGNIQILTTTAPAEQPKLPPEDPTNILTTSHDDLTLEAPTVPANSFSEPVSETADMDKDTTTEFEAYLNLPDTVPNPAPDTVSILTQIGAEAGVKPALVYASFVPPNVATRNGRQAIASREVEGASTKSLTTSTSPLAAKSPAFLASLPGGQSGAIALNRSPDVPGSRRAQLQKEPLANDNDQLELVVVTADGKPVRRLVPGATRGRVLRSVHQFLNEITDPRKTRTTSYLAPAQQLYQWLVAPIEPELKAKGISNLAYISDTGLRFLPMGALHDGHQFLIEKYSVGLMPSLSLTDTRYVSLKNAKVLAMGASEFRNQPPLPAVPTELSVITKKLWPGAAFLNQAFTLSNLRAERQQEPFQIIHLATHGEFQAGALGNSYIQLWDTKLRLDQLRQLGWNNPPVELLVLSACRTALGNDEAELGFAGFAVQAGVKSALASLWYVNDEGTLGLMTEFYHQLRTAPIKAEALRQAQIALLRGTVQIDNGTLRDAQGDTIPLPSSLASDTGTYNLSHPYYWAAFTLIGSPW